MRSIFVILAVLIAGCASLAGVDYQPYAGKTNVYQGEGGTKVIVDNVDLWADGTPPSKFSILGVATIAVGAGSSNEEAVRSVIAGKVKEMGGNGAIQINNNPSFSGVVRSSPSVLLTNEPRQLKFAVVKYA
jgi:hypothetical protein